MDTDPREDPPAPTPSERRKAEKRAKGERGPGGGQPPNVERAVVSAPEKRG